MDIIKTENIFNLEETITKKFIKEFKYPWEIIPSIKNIIVEIGNNLDKKIYTEVKGNVWIAKNAKISATSYIKGPAIIDEYAEIRHCAYIRENVIVGKNTVVGNSVELKNTILFNNVQVPHFNYVGDSILGYKVHLGAGAIVSNLKNDKTNIVIKYTNNNIETNLRKLGAIIGDKSEIGCNCVLNPGTIVLNNVTIYPLCSIRGIIESNTIYKNKDNTVKKNEIGN